ncbi:MAG: hypothetical protein LBJ84_03400 [Oscillospiraceae bacterium]|jgi:hypothetical protein|nr:hypothetical protein [Oscillospiraceae bacterium]
MRSVRVISGTYGWADPDTGRRTAKTLNDAPFDETDVKAARFVKAGVLAYAEYEGGEGAGQAAAKKPFSPDMKFAALKAVAAEALGLDAPAFGTKKDELLALMDARWAEMNGEEGEEGEEGGPLPPLLSGLLPKG